MTLYHAAGPDYQIGAPLESLRRLVDREFFSEAELAVVLARWPEAGDEYLFGDGTLISWTADLEEARAIRSEFNGGVGVILAVEQEALLELGVLTENSEGYPAAAYGELPASILSVIE